jgi:hypothetical protein
MIIGSPFFFPETAETGTRLGKINNFCNWLRSRGFAQFKVQGAFGAFKAAARRLRRLRRVQGRCAAFKRGSGTFYIPLVKNFFNRCYYSLLRCHPGDWTHPTTRYFEGSASFSPFGELTA